VRARRAQAPTGEFVAIDVIDNGIGLSPQEMERIFAPFSQANATIHKTYGGAGLGLSITRQLARAMGGDVTVTSTPGSGATFTLTLRAVSGQRAAA
jgi:signal transduction histidine kinase